MVNRLTHIDSTVRVLPTAAHSRHVYDEGERLGDEAHQVAAQRFLLFDGIGKGLNRDFEFVERIPSFIERIIKDRAWECFWVSGVVLTPYYCHYERLSDRENFWQFIEADFPNGLGTTVETLDRLLLIAPKIRAKFRALLELGRGDEVVPLADPVAAAAYLLDYYGNDSPKETLRERQAILKLGLRLLGNDDE